MSVVARSDGRAECTVTVAPDTSAAALLTAAHAALGLTRPVEEYEAALDSGSVLAHGDDTEVAVYGIQGCDETLEVRLTEVGSARAVLDAAGVELAGMDMATDVIGAAVRDAVDRDTTMLTALALCGYETIAVLLEKALCLAAREGDVEKVACMLDCHVPTELPLGLRRNASPLGCAATAGEEAVVTLLLDHGAPVDTPDTRGHTPLGLAAGKGHRAAAAALLRRGADPNAKGNLKNECTPLLAAVGAGHVEMAADLLAHGAGVGVTGRRGVTPLMAAAAIRLDAPPGPTAMVAQLLASGADVAAVDDFGKTALHFAARAGAHCAVALLLAAGAAVDVPCKQGWLPLHWAADRDAPRVAQQLLESAPAAVQDRPNSTQHTPVHLAAKNSSHDTLVVLLGCGCAVDAADEKGMTPLIFAARNGTAASTQVLLDAGAGLDLAADGYRTALHVAARQANTDVVALLLQRGADPLARDAVGRTPSDETENSQIKELLAAAVPSE
eukprot:TRINITY_DN27624_c0_g1_i1.p1 TRINITY_DN27624_c0_g1~~TRINITY_DN27624_c0_g1_i1.p1  ORF type:complete len:500 (+),score=96.82 TRINITY_DN27624_c0_g1_i1:69-1568(+)